MPALDRRILDDRTRSRELRHLADLRRKAKSVVLRRRMQVVLLLLQGRLTAAVIAKRAGVSRATAFVYWRCYRESGSDGLLKMRPVGRPRGMPSFASDRFDYLVRPELFGGHERPLVYIVEREMRVFRAAGRPCRVVSVAWGAC